MSSTTTHNRFALVEESLAELPSPPAQRQSGFGQCPSQPLPEFGRWQDVQRLFGIKRGTLYNLLGEGKVKSVSMRRKGNKHGCRLFYLPGISEYLRALMDQHPAGGAHE